MPSRPMPAGPTSSASTFTRSTEITTLTAWALPIISMDFTRSRDDIAGRYPFCPPRRAGKWDLMCLAIFLDGASRKCGAMFRS